VNKVQVRCWRITVRGLGGGPPVELFITYPEDNSGHSLVTCLSCGHLFAVTVSKQVYVGPPLEEKLLEATCPQCDHGLNGNWAYYPETHVVDGQVLTHARSSIIPPDEESLVREFDGVYE
jgi:hypothetical protein